MLTKCFVKYQNLHIRWKNMPNEFQLCLLKHFKKNVSDNLKQPSSSQEFSSMCFITCLRPPTFPITIRSIKDLPRVALGNCLPFEKIVCWHLIFLLSISWLRSDESFSVPPSHGCYSFHLTNREGFSFAEVFIRCVIVILMHKLMSEPFSFLFITKKMTLIRKPPLWVLPLLKQISGLP